MHLAVASFKDRGKADALVLPFWRGKKGAEAAFPGSEFSTLVHPIIETGDFSGKEGETHYFVQTKGSEKRIVMLGLGDEKKISSEHLRRSFAKAVKFLRKVKAVKVHFAVPETKVLKSEQIHRGICDGIFLSNYSFDALKGETKKETPPLLKEVTFIGPRKEALADFKKLLTIASCVNFARDLVVGNADDVTPTLLGNKATELAKEFASIKTTIFNRKQIEKEKMGLLAAVARGATTEPAFIIIEYKGAPSSKEQTALIGKGITFDTGGLNLKPTGNIENMRDDMSGAAAVLGTIRAVASLKLKINIIGVIASTENAVGPNSYKPGDVYTAHNGITVEISNTDAEGRLVLADALSYVQEKYAPARMIDLATLTGGIVVALGEEISGLFCNDESLARGLTLAGEITYERVWRMPLFVEYAELLKSKFADIKNAAGRAASPVTAAVFLHRFIKNETPWAHLDIAGTAFPSDLKPYQPSNATGVGVRLLTQFLENLAK